MNKRIAAIIIEIMPIISAIIALSLILSPAKAAWLKPIISVTTLLAFLGVGVFFAGHKLVKGDRIVSIIGIADILATISIVLLYIIAIFNFGL